MGVVLEKGLEGGESGLGDRVVVRGLGRLGFGDGDGRERFVVNCVIEGKEGKDVAMEFGRIGLKEVVVVRVVRNHDEGV